MLNKRIAGFVAGTALAASAVFVPQAAAQDLVQDSNGVWGYLQTINTQQQGHITVFVPNGKAVVPLPDTWPAPDHQNCFTHNAQWDSINYNFPQVTDGTTTVNGATRYVVSDACSTGEYVDPDLDPEDPDNGSSAGSALLGSALLSSGSSAIPDHDGDGGSAAGSALGLSALAGSALLSSGAASSASSDDSDPAPAPAPGDGDNGGPATGPVGGDDPKAAAQAQAANAPAKASPAPAKAAPAPAAQQQQLANTGVEGTLAALAAGLVAVAAGALLVLRRRA